MYTLGQIGMLLGGSSWITLVLFSVTCILERASAGLRLPLASASKIRKIIESPNRFGQSAKISEMGGWLITAA